MYADADTNKTKKNIVREKITAPSRPKNWQRESAWDGNRIKHLNTLTAVLKLRTIDWKVEGLFQTGSSLRTRNRQLVPLKIEFCMSLYAKRIDTGN